MFLRRGIRCGSARLFSSGSSQAAREQPQTQEMLTREFIRRSLYQEDVGYFSVTDCVYRNEDGIDFRSLIGKQSYLGALEKLYKATEQAWLTPVEIFQPWYSRALGNYFEKNHTPGKPLKIYEIGGGNGTNAVHILDYLQAYSPALYKDTTYTLVEVSAAMAQRQRSIVGQVHPQQCRIINDDFCEWKGAVEEDDCFVLALEVLDNLPHDKLVRRIGEDKKNWHIYSDENASEWFETHVRIDDHSKYSEFTLPLQDPVAVETAKLFLKPGFFDQGRVNKTEKAQGLYSMAVDFCRDSIWEAREAIESNTGDFGQVFVPTGSVKLLHVLKSNFPKHKLLVADFDSLPPPDLSLFETWRNKFVEGSVIGSRNAPLVAGRNARGKHVDFPTYLVPIGTADIFFQTNFHMLASAYQTIIGKRPELLKSRDFLEQYSEHRYTRTRSGYNPMLEDYHNTQFMFS